MAIVMVVLGALALGTEHYTSRPEFCGSCHIMDAYFTSWHKDPHATEKAYARCVDCHYAPGEQHTLRAKFRGLSQVASYFSGRSGAGRPKAHVSDRSCLTSGCHGDRKFMNAVTKIGNVTFTHAKHLDPDSENLVEIRRKLDATRERLAARLDADQMAVVRRIGGAIEPPAKRNERLAEWLVANSLEPLREEVLAFAELLHLEARLAQLANLRCASCHQFDSSLSNHFAPALTTCYTCHFIHQPFNAGTGRCLLCHSPPAGPVPVHFGEAGTTLSAGSASTTTITMDHAVILANNVNCASCHSDLVQGSGEVSPRDCQNCHDQARYLKDFDARTVEVVRMYHEVHSAGQHARCNDCHRLIDHRLLPVTAAGGPESLLEPVVRDCQHCHPGHHHEQVEFLLGRGGAVEGAEGLPNPMIGTRVNCQACHTRPGTDPQGRAVIRSTAESCRGCHGPEYERLFEQWRQSIAARLQEGTDLLARAEERHRATSRPADPVSKQAGERIARARTNLALVATAHGIHNRNYALLLLDQAIRDLEQALDLMAR